MRTNEFDFKDTSPNANNTEFKEQKFGGEPSAMDLSVTTYLKVNAEQAKQQANAGQNAQQDSGFFNAPDQAQQQARSSVVAQPAESSQPAEPED